MATARMKPDAAPKAARSAAAFVRTPLSVRGHIVAVWQALPSDIWDALSDDNEYRRAVATERRSVFGVVAMTLLLLTVFASVGYQETIDGATVRYPVLGRAVPQAVPPTAHDGWYFEPGQSFGLAAWTALPPLLGWMLVRLVWIPAVAQNSPAHRTRLTFARHLGAVYFYVYLAIVAGASLLPLFIWVSPSGNGWFRWWIWCFLFGESFFVPALMWIRLVLHDKGGAVFGRHRLATLTLYLLICVGAPLAAMVQRL